jgi:hypothetical protein
MFCCSDEQAVATGISGDIKSRLTLPGKKGICFLTSKPENMEKIVKVRRTGHN